MPGQKLLLRGDGTAAGTVGGGGIERSVIRRMQELIGGSTVAPQALSYNLAKDLGMACGGHVQLIVEPMSSATPLLLIGAGHVGFEVARLASTLQFRVTLVDERPSTLVPERIAAIPGIRTFCGTANTVPHGVPTCGAVVVATHAHELDQAALFWAVDEDYAYIGGVGSRAKAVKLRTALQERGTPQERIDRMRMPVGTGIGARTPAELAVSIVGELIAWRSGTAFA